MCPAITIDSLGVKMSKITNWVPEIYYEEIDNGVTSSIPFISVPNNHLMPGVLFIFESRETGEIEPGQEGEDVNVVEVTLHQFADMQKLKDELSPPEFDKVRSVLGLEPLASAVKKGKVITSQVRENVEGAE